MKLSIKLFFEKDQNYKFDYSVIQSIFYNILKASTLDEYHGKDLGLFCYSNIYFEKNENFIKYS